MEVKINNISNSLQEVEVTLNYDEISQEIANAYNEERKKISLPGFRKGKVPIELLKKLYRDAIEYQASEKIATKKFWDIVDKEKLKPINTPKLTDINFIIDSKLSFKVQYEILPKIELKDYKGLTIEKPIFKISENEIDKEIDYLIKPYLKFEDAEVVDGANYKITVNLQRINENNESNEPIKEPKGENLVINLSDENVNPQIINNAKNKRVGENFNFEFVDEHYHGDEKHTVTYRYTARILKIEKIIYPDLTDELVKKISKNKANNIEELRQQVKEDIEAYYKKQSEDIYLNNLLNAIVKNNDFEPPQGYVNTILENFVQQEKSHYSSKKNNLKNFDEKAVEEYYKPRAVWNAKWQIILENLCEKENIKVDDTDIEEIAKKESEATGISVAKLVNYYKNSDRLNSLREEKAIKFLIENNKVKEVNPEHKN
ncbi:trigger factor [Melioribacteraceae bacterium 4301-Me]|uniref:trigger factor n=1 Tax=Pyranulibacter aquaticus TaxID=3163344 RepID=UPI00359B705F